MRAIIRTLSFFEQWAAEVLRQPALMFTLIIAPFLLLLAFGQGVEIGGPRPKTLLVQPADAQQPIAPLLQDIEQVEIVGVTESLPIARRLLQRGDVDAVAVLPGNPNEIIASGEQVPIRVLIGEIDPVRRSYARGHLLDQIAILNQLAVAEALTQARGTTGNTGESVAEARSALDRLRGGGNRNQSLEAVRELKGAVGPLQGGVAAAAAGGLLVIPGLSEAAGGPAGLSAAITDLTTTIDGAEQRLQGSSGPDTLTPAELDRIESSLDVVEAGSGGLASVDPYVLSAPFRLEMEDATPITPSFTSFYSPSVVTLLVQHLGITLAALTLSRMRLLRVTDTLRVAPVRTGEIVFGNYLSYAVLTGLAAAGLLAMLVLGLNVPIVGSYAWVAGLIALLIFSSLGIGFLASQLSSSVQQAAQIAMLILLASVFFGGFAFSLDRIEWPVRAISYALPATYGIRSLQDVMLRGFDPALTDVAVLAGSAAVLFVLNVLVLRRSMRATAR